MGLDYEKIVREHPSDPLAILQLCGGYYNCPKALDGKRLGPLVAYAARYDGNLQWVGDTYVNFAKAENHPALVWHFATGMSKQFRAIMAVHNEVFCGAPEGGKALAVILALLNHRPYIFPEKKVIALGTSGSREQSELVWGRHSVEPGQRIIIVEDVANNFSTTDKLIQLIEDGGAEVAAIVCFLNRSTTVKASYKGIPIFSLVQQEIPEYRQDDERVASDMAAGNVVLKPKDQWSLLATAMKQAQVA
jgi:orotate phosphoribosyltransferase